MSSPNMEVFQAAVLLFFFLVSKSGSEIFPLKSLGFDSFLTCLVEGGINPTDVVPRSDSEAYQTLNFQWQQKPPARIPAAYVVVRTENDVMEVVRCGRKLNVHLVPRGGAHSFEKFSFGQENSVVVDVKKLRTLSINQSAMAATVGAGWLVGPLTWALWEQGQSFTSLGICPSVGISGLATGGGYGYFHRQFGLTIDNILEMDVVTATGELMTVNRENNSDLFWALRGGVGSSFGIVTSFVLRIHRAPPAVFRGNLTFHVSQLEEVFTSWQSLVRTGNRSVTPFLTVRKGNIELAIVDWTGTEGNFNQLVDDFPPYDSRNGEVFIYPDFIESYAGKESPWLSMCVAIKQTKSVKFA